jgi:SAM-dependent methyltransferase
MVCETCWLVQTEDTVDFRELFTDGYAYLSSFSDSWLRHCRDYTSMAIGRFGLDGSSHVVEVASNDGYLLQYFRSAGIPCLGVEPTRLAAEAAREKGIPTLIRFFDPALARELQNEGREADLMIGNNVLAHVPDLNAFLTGFRILLKPGGTATFEFPHLLRLIEGLQFDTIYHEHFSYFSLHAVKAALERNGLEPYDVEELPTHGGSLRIYCQRSDTGPHPIRQAVKSILATEAAGGLLRGETYSNFQGRIDSIKLDLLSFLIDQKRLGKTVAGYGAAAKANTLLNFAGIRSDLLPFIADRNPSKIGHYMPGNRIPIVAETEIDRRRPDYLLLLPWNLKVELSGQLEYVYAWGGRLVVASPALAMYDQNGYWTSIQGRPR